MDAAQQFLSELFYCIIAWLAIAAGIIVIAGCYIYAAIVERRPAKNRKAVVLPTRPANAPPACSTHSTERPRERNYCLTVFKDRAGHTYIFMWSASNFQQAVCRMLGMAADKMFSLTKDEAGHLLRRMLQQRFAAACEEAREAIKDAESDAANANGTPGWHN